MKKRMTMILLFLAAMAKQAVATDYPIYVAGIQVTDQNKDNITGSGIKALDPDKPFKVWFEPEYNGKADNWVLLMENALIEHYGEQVAAINVTGGTMFTIGVITHGSAPQPSRARIVTDKCGILCATTSYLQINLSAYASSLTIESASLGISATSSNVYVTHDISVYSDFIALYGNDKAILNSGRVNGLHLEAKGQYGAISGFADFTLKDKAGNTYQSNATLGYKNDGSGYAARVLNSYGEWVLANYVCLGMYPVKVGGVWVTDKNKDNITGDCIGAIDPSKPAKAWFEPNYNNSEGNNVLFLENVSINTQDTYHHGVQVSGDNPFTICAITEDGQSSRAKIKSDQDGIHLENTNRAQLNMTSFESVLMIEGKHNGVYKSGGNTLYVLKTIKVSSLYGGDGICSDGSAKLSSNNTAGLILNAQASGAALRGFASIELKGNGHEYTSNAVFSNTGDGNGWAARNPDNTNQLVSNLELGTYPVTVAGIPVTATNKNNITGPAISALDSEKPYKVWLTHNDADYASYDCLYLENAVINTKGSSNHGILANGPYNFILYVQDSQNKASSAKILSDKDGANLSNKGFVQFNMGSEESSLIIDAGGYGVMKKNQYLSIYNQLDVTGQQGAFYSDGTAELNSSKADGLKLTATSPNGAIRGFSNIEMKKKNNYDYESNALFAYKDDGYGWAARKKGDDSKLEETVYVGYTDIQPVKVAGIQVTKQNMANITGPGISALDPNEPSAITLTTEQDGQLRLTLKNVKIDVTGENAIEFDNTVKDFEIFFESQSSIRTDRYGVLSYANSTKLFGNGANTIEGSICGIKAGNDLSLEGALYVKGWTNAIFGSGNGQLSLNNIRALKAEANGIVIGGFSTLSLPSHVSDYYTNADFQKTDDGNGMAARDQNGDPVTNGTVIYALALPVQLGSYRLNAADQFSESIWMDSNGVTGRVYADASSNTVYLEDVTIEAMTDDNPTGITVDLNTQNWTISLRGSNHINAKGDGIKVNMTDLAALTLKDGRTSELEAAPELTITAGETGIDLTGYNCLTVEGEPKMVIDAAEVGIYGDDGKASLSLIGEMNLRIRGAAWGAINNVRRLYFPAIEILTPGVIVDEVGNGYSLIYEENEERVTDWVEMRHYVHYFDIGFYTVDESNVDKPISDPSIKGSVTYNKNTGVLTLNNVTIEGGGGLYAYPGKVSEVKVDGTNVIDGDVSFAGNMVNMYSNSQATLSGEGYLRCYDGWLTLTSLTIDGMAMDNDNTSNILLKSCTATSASAWRNEGTLYIDNSQVDIANYNNEYGTAIQNYGTLNISNNSKVKAAGQYFGYEGKKGSKLIIDRSKASFSANTYYDDNNDTPCGAILGYDLTLQGEVEFVTDGGYYVDFGEDGYFTVRNLEGKRATDWVTFDVPIEKQTYGIYVGEVEITGLNYDEVTGDNINGLVTYDPENQVLTLKNATISDRGIYMDYGIGPVTIMLEGNNKLAGSNFMEASLTANDLVTITSADGNGKLTINGDMIGTMFISGADISHCKLDVTSYGQGLFGIGTLTIDGAELNVKGDAASIIGFDDVVLTGGSYIESPAGAAYNTDAMELQVGGNTVNTMVNIAVGPTEEITISSVGVAGFSSNLNLDFTSMKAKGLSAWIATGFRKGNVQLSRVYKVPAKTGVYLKAAGGGTFTVPFDPVGNTYYANMFQPVIEARTVPQKENVGGTDYLTYYFALSKTTNLPTFYPTAAGGKALAAKKMYMRMPESLNLNDNGTTTSQTVSVTVSEVGAAGFSCTQAVDFTNVKGVSAWIATGFNEGNILLSRVYAVPAGMGVYVKADKPGTAKTYNIPVTTEAPYYENLFVGTAGAAKDVPKFETVNGVKFLTLYFAKDKNTQKPTFYPNTGTKTIAANKMYLHLPAWLLPEYDNSRTLGLQFLDDDETTGIDEFGEAEPLNNKEQRINDKRGGVYDLQGRKLDDVGAGPVPARLHKGLYIIGGKKVVIK